MEGDIGRKRVGEWRKKYWLGTKKWKGPPLSPPHTLLSWETDYEQNRMRRTSSD